MTPRSGVRAARGICIAGGAGRRDIQGLMWVWRRRGIGGWDWKGEGRVVDGMVWKKVGFKEWVLRGQ